MGDPMTEERLALTELLEKAGDGDFLRTVAEAVLQLLMDRRGRVVRYSVSLPISGFPAG
jgi:hypothetical protein